MRPGPIFKVLGILLMFLSLTMLTPMIVNWIYDEHNGKPFLLSFIITMISGLLLWLLSSRSKKELTIKGGFIVVIAIWSVLGLYGSIPYMLSNGLHLEFSDAVFESVSGFTTTGATVIHGLDSLPKSILYYRQQTQLLGGMGIIILSVAILPMLGVGGMQLYRAEANGPWKENKLTPRIADTAKVLWGIYLLLVVLCILSYKLGGMTWFNAVCYAYSTIGTGGFAPSDASMGGQTPLIYSICIFYMMVSATSFALHFTAFRRLSLKVYWRDPEFRAYIFFAFSMMVIVVLTLISQDATKSNDLAFWDGLFQVVSFVSNTGFTSDSNYHSWPLFIPILLMVIGLIGGCAGSSSGGLKIVRAVLLRKQAFREARRLVHPSGVFPVKFGNKVMSEAVMSSVWGFVAAYFIMFVILWLCMMGVGVESITAFSAVAASISNLGPGLGHVGVNYAMLPTQAHWILNFAMLLGRLEVFTILVLFTPDFWRR
ncbi:potassium transporter TrkG [Fastidiosibacter lacustris]|uniref:potassium transporter TrkG n=1 Tax=Fastidiosibacter lacustris TaxID=2056695 RepID=UPI000E340774|nr:potassium transporter TrkG [Fastidiosibacter lacustris]